MFVFWDLFDTSTKSELLRCSVSFIFNITLVWLGVGIVVRV